MPDLVIKDVSNVTVDGVAAGALVDVIANHKPDPADLHAAFVAWEDSHAADKQTSLDRQHKALSDAHAADVASQAAAHASELAAAQKRIDDLTAQAKEQDAQIAALGGTELGQRLAREARRKQLQESIGRHQAELTKLDAGAPQSP